MLGEERGQSALPLEKVPKTSERLVQLVPNDVICMPSFGTMLAEGATRGGT